MPKTRIFCLLLAFAMLVSVATIFTVGISTGTAAPATDIIISEVLYDAPNSDTAEEWIELFNPTSSSVDLGGWTVTDNYATYSLSGTIPASGYFVIARSSSGFSSLYGYSPDLSGMTLALGNSGDQVILKNSGTEVDFVAWENYVSGWGIYATNTAIARATSDDTDSVSDWENTGDYGTPGTGTLVGGSGSDTTAPTVSFTNPGNGATVGGVISVTFDASDDSGISSMELYIDGGFVSSSNSFTWDTTFESDGSHSLLSKAQDVAGNWGEDAITVTVDNTVPPPPPADSVAGFEGILYTGQLHNHAGEWGDDGTGSVEYNMDYMQNSADPALDFGGLSPHSHMLSDSDMINYWNDMGTSTSTFVPITGQEWSSLSTSGHVNIFNADARCGVSNGDIPGFYNWLVSSGGYGSFNHPWDSSGSDMNNWQYYASADKPGNYAGKMVMMELDQDGTAGWADYTEALGKGWHIGISVSDDEHNGNPGNKYTNRPRTGMWLESLSSASVEKAFQELRFFASQVSNGYVDIQVGSYSMGDIFSGTNGMTLTAMLNPDLSYNYVDLYIDGSAYTMNYQSAGSYTFTIDASSSHYYFVRAQTSSGDYIVSSPIWSDPSVNPPPEDTTPPAKVSGLSAVSAGTSQIDLTWDANSESDLDFYKVYREGVAIVQLSGTSFSDTGLSAETTYTYQVSAVDTTGNEGLKSVSASATTDTPPDTTAPVKVSGLSAVSVSTSQIDLTWNANSESDLDHYVIYRDSVLLTTTTGTAFSDNGLVASTTYTYEVSAVDTVGNEGVKSDSTSATTDTPLDITAPAKVSGLNANAVGTSQIDLTWNANSEDDLDHYVIYRDGVFLTTTTSIAFSDTGLNADTSYSYEVSAVDAVGNEGVKSDTTSATTDPETPPPQDTGMYVASIVMWHEAPKKVNLYVEVTVVDENGNPLAGVSVSITINKPRGSAVFSGTTDANGKVVFELGNCKSGTYEAVVDSLSLSGYVYMPGLNVETTDSYYVPK